VESRSSGTFSRLAAQAGCAIPVLGRHVAFRNREFSWTILLVRQTTQRDAVQEEYIEINQTFAGSLFTSFSSQERFLHIHRLRFPSGTCIINNYWIRLSTILLRIWEIIKAEVWVIFRSRSLRQITQTKVLTIPRILREPNSIIVLLFIYF
jgi:hypothetical protein